MYKQIYDTLFTSVSAVTLLCVLLLSSPLFVNDDKFLYWNDKLCLEVLKELNRYFVFSFGIESEIVTSMIGAVLKRVSERDLLLGTTNALFKNGTLFISLISGFLAQSIGLVGTTLLFGVAIMSLSIIMFPVDLMYNLDSKNAETATNIKFTLDNLCIKDCLVKELSFYQNEKEVSQIYFSCLDQCLSERAF